MFTSLRALRVLRIRHWRTQEFSLPASIVWLKHLPYAIFLSGGKVPLPQRQLFYHHTFSRLYHLQLLHCPWIDFSACQVFKLINLRHLLCLGNLDIPNISWLVSLQTLRSFWVKKEPGYELRQLKHLNKLRDKLGIHGTLQESSDQNQLLGQNHATPYSARPCAIYSYRRN